MDMNNKNRFVPVRNHRALNALALVGRIVTLPAVLAMVVLFTLYLARPNVFLHTADFFVSLFTLVLCPVLAYPLAKLIPSLRRQGREGARNTAFLTSLIGYLGGITYAFAVGASSELCFIQVTYFFSAVFLFFCNKAVGIRASAHSCGACGAAVIFGAVMGGFAWIASLLTVLYALWCSLYRKRHDGREFFFGALCVLGGFMIALLCAVLGTVHLPHKF